MSPLDSNRLLEKARISSRVFAAQGGFGDEDVFLAYAAAAIRQNAGSFNHVS